MSQETTGNEKFLNILFENLGGVELGWDKDQFIKRMATDAVYNDKVYNRFIDMYGDQEFTYEDFEYGTGLKKKRRRAGSRRGFINLLQMGQRSFCRRVGRWYRRLYKSS